MMRNFVIFFGLIGILMVVAPPGVQAEEIEKVKPEETYKHWVGGYASFGRHSHIWSSSVYTGYKNWALGAFYEWESNPWIPLPADIIRRTWQAELHYKRLWGTIPLDEDQIPPEDRDGPPYSTELDHYQFALRLVRRWVFLPDYFIRPTLHLGFGMSLLNRTIIDDGTLHSFDFVGGGGVEIDLSKRWTLFADLRWEHFSNGGQIYMTNAAVIGPESLNGVFGLRYLL